MPQDLVKAKDIYVRVYVFRCVDKTFGIYETRAQHQPKQQAANKVLWPKRLTKKSKNDNDVKRKENTITIFKPPFQLT